MLALSVRAASVYLRSSRPQDARRMTPLRRRALQDVVPGGNEEVGPVAGEAVDGSTRSSGEPAAESEQRAQSYAARLAPADVLLARMDLSFRYPALVPCKVVGVAHSNPFFADF